MDQHELCSTAKASAGRYGIPGRNCLLPTAYSAHCPLPTAHCPLPTAYCPLPTAHCPLPTAHCLLPTAYCLLPTAYCLLPTAYCLLPTAYYQSRLGFGWPSSRRYPVSAARSR